MGERGGIEALVRGGLAEGWRLAAEAQAATRSRYQDLNTGLVALGMLLFVFFVFVTYGLFEGTGSAGGYATVASLAIVVAVVGPPLYVNKRIYGRRMAELDRWMARLQHPEPDGSMFDLLVEVSHQVPVWTAAKERDRLRSHPFLTTAMVIGAASTAYLAWTAIEHRGDGSFPYLAIMLVAFAALFVGSSYAIAEIDRRERERTFARWSERLEASRRALEKALEDL